ncbi:MAG: magnesium and cobalt transporter CorA [Actinomycetota bacterium]|jgi:magnesium transporter
MANTTIRVFRDGVLVDAEAGLDALPDLLGRPGTLLWIDLVSPDKPTMQKVGDHLGLHELAVDDAVSPHQRPKVDRYDSHLFMSAHAVTASPHGHLRETEVNLFSDTNWIVTVRKGTQFDLAPVLDRTSRSADLSRYGIGFIAWAVLDVIVDGYLDAIQVFDDYYDKVSEGLFADQPLDLNGQREWFTMRKALVRMHRLITPLREVVNELMRREHQSFHEGLFPWFQDVYDHAIRATEATDQLRDLVTTIAETNIALRDFRQNQQVKKVTGWAAIVAVPTLITGWYGMNVPYPGYDQGWGVLTAAGLSIGVSAGLYVIFKSRDWL